MNARAEYHASFAGYRVPRTEFDLALHALTATPYRLARDGRRRIMLEALDGRATWEQIKHWRAGRRSAPKWALELLARKMSERRAVLDRGIFAALKNKTAGD